MDITLINASKIAIVDYVLSDEECTKLSDYAIYVKKNDIDIKNVAELDLEAESYDNVLYWKAKNLYLEYCDQEYRDIASTLGLRYVEIFKEYLSLIGVPNVTFDADQIQPTVVHVYREGDNLDRHKDGRDFALVFYLNESPDFIGGDLIYTDLGIHIPPKRGRLVIAPSNEIHEVLEVLSGFRCSMTVFVDVV